ncbi:hypothetical protein FB451DRAFT_1162755 [Mycena latifolia]|nr:hypothetical protein FB451DRAFT_1162755 [Mycena latifolia]
MPLYDIEASPGEGWVKRDGTSLESYNYSYAPRRDILNLASGVQPPLDVGTPVYGPGLEAWYCASVRSKIRRIEDFDVDLETGRPLNTISRRRAEEGSAFLLGIAAVSRGGEYQPAPERNERRSTIQRFRTQAKRAFRRIKPAAPQLTVVAHDLVSRGWDATNCQWRQPIYPLLDKFFRAIDEVADSSLAAYKICLP